MHGIRREMNEQEMVRRLKELKAYAYGQTTSIWDMLHDMTDDEIEDMFSEMFISLLQESRGCGCCRGQSE